MILEVLEVDLVRLSVLSCGSVCRSCVTVIARLASTVSQSLVGLRFAFPSMYVDIEVMRSKAALLVVGRT